MITILRITSLKLSYYKAQRRLIMGKGVELTTTKYLIHAQIRSFKQRFRFKRAPKNWKNRKDPSYHSLKWWTCKR